jgi:hypothetical protein
MRTSKNGQVRTVTWELAERVERLGEVLRARAESAIGKVTVGPHA